MNPQFWWYVSRATGVVAWVLSMGAVLWGLALASGFTGRRPSKPWVTDLHRYLGGATVAFVAAHLGALVADGYVHFGVRELAVPFASSWKPGAVAAGVVAMWLLAAVEVTSLLRRRLSKRAWRAVHLTSYLAAVLSTVHYATAGTDARNPFLGWAPIVVVSLAVMLLTYRAFAPRRPPRAAHPLTPPPRPPLTHEPSGVLQTVRTVGLKLTRREGRPAGAGK